LGGLNGGLIQVLHVI